MGQARPDIPSTKFADTESEPLWTVREREELKASTKIKIHLCVVEGGAVVMVFICFLQN